MGKAGISELERNLVKALWSQSYAAIRNKNRS